MRPGSGRQRQGNSYESHSRPATPTGKWAIIAGSFPGQQYRSDSEWHSVRALSICPAGANERAEHFLLRPARVVSTYIQSPWSALASPCHAHHFVAHHSVVVTHTYRSPLTNGRDSTRQSVLGRSPPSFHLLFDLTICVTRQFGVKSITTSQHIFSRHLLRLSKHTPLAVTAANVLGRVI